MIEIYKMEEVVHLDKIPAKILHQMVEGEGCYVPLHWHKDIASIQTSFIWIPIVFTVVIIVLMMFYKLDGMMPQIQAELEKRREQASE